MKRYIILLIAIWGGMSGDSAKANTFVAPPFQENEYIGGQQMPSETTLGENAFFSEMNELTAAAPGTDPGSNPFGDRFSLGNTVPVSDAYPALLLAALFYGVYKRKKLGKAHSVPHHL